MRSDASRADFQNRKDPGSLCMEPPTALNTSVKSVDVSVQLSAGKPLRVFVVLDFAAPRAHPSRQLRPPRQHFPPAPHTAETRSQRLGKAQVSLHQSLA